MKTKHQNKHRFLLAFTYSTGIRLNELRFVKISDIDTDRILHYPKNPNKIPAATAEPITPATFGPMACISK